MDTPLDKEEHKTFAYIIRSGDSLDYGEQLRLLDAYDTLTAQNQALRDEMGHLSKVGYLTASVCIEHGCQHNTVSDQLYRRIRSLTTALGELCAVSEPFQRVPTREDDPIKDQLPLALKQAYDALALGEQGV